MTQMFTLQEVSQMLKVSSKTIDREVRAGKLLGTKVGWQWRFTEESIDKYIKSRTIKKAA